MLLNVLTNGFDSATQKKQTSRRVIGSSFRESNTGPYLVKVGVRGGGGGGGGGKRMLNPRRDPGRTIEAGPSL